MMNWNKGFKREEFACKCGCGFDTVDIELYYVVVAVREYFRKPVFINSACRCTQHNKAVGGTKNSQHVMGRATDIKVQGVDPKEVYAYLDKRFGDKISLGSYETFTHVDTRTNSPARW